ncbi:MULTISPECIES: hypothetical protein [Enterococcus]|uniref:hypothetical protein n=1 Tax=Enterococcus TaxID=1350 RepID=UPI0020907257|nr:hypothetical protein [Enterococcus hirae]MCO5510958.1 hypothetical protein [Enterococcus hirae]HCD9886084.1 hypothetical protein [Enterococcus faecium]
MINDQFWKDYEKSVANPVNRSLNKNKLNQMEREIDQATQFILSKNINFNEVDRDSLESNLDSLRVAESYRKKQLSLLTNAAFYPKKRLEGLENLISKILTEKIIIERELAYLAYSKDVREHESVYTEDDQLIKPEYTLGQLKNLVNQSEDGLFRVPDSEMTVADERYFNKIQIESDEQIICISTLEPECDYFIFTDTFVTWIDNWSGEDDRVYKGEVLKQLKFSFGEETFEVEKGKLVKQEKKQLNEQEENNYTVLKHF